MKKTPSALFFTALGLWAGIALSGCGKEAAITPKPRAYPKVEYPTKAYQSFDADYCAFTFQYPVYARVQQDTSFFGEKPIHPCWFDLYFPDFDSRLYCTYSVIQKPADLEKLKQDAFDMVDWHKKKANYVDEIAINRPGKVSGFYFDIQGPAASPLQFYLTDSTHHFFRGALYFNTQSRPDSLAPVYDFLRKDVIKMLSTFEWNKAGR